jgi:hypothetical protein
MHSSGFSVYYSELYRASFMSLCTLPCFHIILHSESSFYILFGTLHNRLSATILPLCRAAAFILHYAWPSFYYSVLCRVFVQLFYSHDLLPVILDSTGSPLDWGYKTEPGSSGSAFIETRGLMWRGKVIGGTSGTSHSYRQ